MDRISVYKCKECNEEYETTTDYGCPRCGGNSKRIYSYGTCEMCGERVGLDGLTNECTGCGALYNAFGHRLSDPSCWDDDERYECFGPQNYAYDY